jgi:hypothetical protein
MLVLLLLLLAELLLLLLAELLFLRLVLKLLHV